MNEYLYSSMSTLIVTGLEMCLFNWLVDTFRMLMIPFLTKAFPFFYNLLKQLVVYFLNASLGMNPNWVTARFDCVTNIHPVVQHSGS